MAKDAPDGIKLVQATIMVGSEPIVEQPSTETVVLETEGKVSTSSSSYQTLATWTVSAGKAGILRALELASDNYSLAQFRITIGGVVAIAGWVLPDAWSGYFAECRLAAETVVLLEGKSDGATTIKLWGAIEGKEIG